MELILRTTKKQAENTVTSKKKVRTKKQCLINSEENQKGF